MSKSFYQQFLEADDLSLHKWHHYFPVYEKHFSKFAGKPLKFLEIGVQQGDSSKLFRRMLGEGCHVVGVDIDPRSQEAAIPNEIDIEIGDQTDRDFLSRIAEQYGPFDIILDDGGHTLNQIWTSYDVLFPSLKEGGVYLIEDIHAQFWRSESWRDDPQGRTVTDFVESLLFALHEDSGRHELFWYWHTPPEDRKKDLSAQGENRSIANVSLYDSIIAIDKEKRPDLYSEIRQPKDSYPELGAKIQAQIDAFDCSLDYRPLNPIYVAGKKIPTAKYNRAVARVRELENELKELKAKIEGTNK